MADEEQTWASRWRPWLLLPVGLLWLVGTLLKETPQFWRNEGGFPIPLRAFILDFYYPYLGVFLLTCAFALGRDMLQGQRPSRSSLIGWTILGLVIGAGLALLVSNNLVNLIENQPLHYHGR
jgi:hypothetical protein